MTDVERKAMQLLHLAGHLLIERHDLRNTMRGLLDNAFCGCCDGYCGQDAGGRDRWAKAQSRADELLARPINVGEDELRVHARRIVATVVGDSATVPWVIAFARLMESKLAENRHKGDRAGWVQMRSDWLFDRMVDEAKELRAQLPYRMGVRGVDDPSYGCDGTPLTARRECADVSNFAMMIADVAGGMEPVTIEAIVDRFLESIRPADPDSAETEGG